jgi:uncharacterized membrane protein
MTSPGFVPLFAQQTELWSNSVAGLIVPLSVIISGIGVAVIAWGTYSSVLRLIAFETAAARGQLPKAEGVNDRFVFATYLISGLDFLTAGSVIKAVVAPDWQQAGLLASLVFARTLVGLSLRCGITPAPGLTALPPVTTEQLAAPVPPSHSPTTTVEDVAPVSFHAAPQAPLLRPSQRIVP